MTDKPNTFSRRAFAGSALLVGALAASRAIGAPALTRESPMGPFYPTGYAGEDDFDLTLLKGRPGRAIGDQAFTGEWMADVHEFAGNSARVWCWAASRSAGFERAAPPQPDPADADRPPTGPRA